MITTTNKMQVKSYKFDVEKTAQKVNDGSVFDTIRKELSTLIKLDIDNDTNKLVNNHYFKYDIYFNVNTSNFTLNYSYGHSIYIRNISYKNKRLYDDLTKFCVNEEDIFDDVIRLIKKVNALNIVEDYYQYQLETESFFNFDDLFHPDCDIEDYFTKLLHNNRMNNDNYHLIQDEKYIKIFNKLLLDELKNLTAYSDIIDNFKNLIPYLEKYQIRLCYEATIKYLIKYDHNSNLLSLKDKLPAILTDDCLHLGQYQDIFISELKKALKKESNELLNDNYLYTKHSSTLSTLIEIKDYFSTITTHSFHLNGARINNLDHFLKVDKNSYVVNNLILFPHINNTIEINDTDKFLWQSNMMVFQNISDHQQKVYQVYDSIDNIKTTIEMIEKQIQLGIVIETNNLKDIINYLKRTQELLENLKENGLLIDIKLSDLSKFDYLIQ